MGSISTWRARRAFASLLAVLTLGLVGPSTVRTADAVTTTPTQEPNDPWPERLFPGEQLAPGQFLRYATFRFRLVMQTDGNLVEYGDIPLGWPLGDRPLGPTWSSGTSGHPGAVLRMQTDGNLVIYSAAGRPLWQTGTAGYPGVRAELLKNGSFILRSSADPGARQLPGTGVVAITKEGGRLHDWRLFSGDTMRLPDRLEERDGRFRVVMQSDGNLVLLAQIRKWVGTEIGPIWVVDGYMPFWSSGTHGNPGAVLRMQTDGNLVIYSAAGRALWHSRTAGHPGAHLVMQPDGNLVIYATAGQALWQSQTAGVRAPEIPL